MPFRLLWVFSILSICEGFFAFHRLASPYLKSRWDTSVHHRTTKLSENDERREFDKVLTALKLYRDINGNFNIPPGYKVPPHNSWPSTFHGLRLAAWHRKIIYQGVFSNYREELESIGLVLRKNVEKFEQFLKALLIYKELNDGNLKVRTILVILLPCREN
jgi:hypothetical protein